MHHFCTYFDHNYLGRGLTLYASLKRHMADAVLHVLALSDECENVLGKLALPDLNVVSLATLEAFDPELTERKRQRPRVEYYFTLSPCWPRYLLTSSPDVDLLTYVDADCAIFSDPSPVLAEMSGHSVGMVGHRFPEKLSERQVYGRYNVGWLSFRNDSGGLTCLDWWRERCIEWCEDRLDGERYADQKYLDQWPRLFAGVRELEYPGVNVAPWNVERFRLSVRDGSLLVDERPLVCYHFHGCKQALGMFWGMGFSTYVENPDDALRRYVYLPYVRELRRWGSLVKNMVRVNAGGVRYMENHSGLWMRWRHVRHLARRHDLLFGW